MSAPWYKTKRGVYIDLSYSPYEVISSYGDCLKFSSAKKLDMYVRDLPIVLSMVKTMCDKINSLTDSKECDFERLRHLVEISTYRRIEK